jgi:hypothetical protein
LAGYCSIIAERFTASLGDQKGMASGGCTFAPYQETVRIALVHLDVTGEFDRVIDAIRATDAETKGDIADVEVDEAITRRAAELLGSKRNDAYEAALKVLREDTRQWWAATLARDPLVCSRHRQQRSGALAPSRSGPRRVRRSLCCRPLLFEGSALERTQWA